MKRYRMLIVDVDESYCEYLTSAFSEDKSIQVIGCASDGVNALQMILADKPDIVLMDPILPGMDGMLLMHELKISACRPMVICISRFYTSVSIEIARKSGASYYLYKPVRPDALSRIIIECAETYHQEHRCERMQSETSGSDAVRYQIHTIIKELGFPGKLSGSQYMEDAIAIAAQTPTAINNLTSGLYAELARRDNTTASCVERCMRTAISKANANGQLTRRMGSAPTNKACIRYILDVLKAVAQ